MTVYTVVAARPLDGDPGPRLYLLEIARETGRPGMLDHLSFEGQDYLVCGLVDDGDGTGPVVLAMRQGREQ